MSIRQQRQRRTEKCLAIVAAALMGTGCAGGAEKSASKSPPPSAGKGPQAVVGNTDACASQLHDLCGAFLVYLTTHPTLPPSLEDLDKSMLPKGSGSGIFFCPLAKQGYVYKPNGILLPEKNARIILYDAAPAHSGFRMAIRAEEPDGGLAPVMKVVALPESFFLLRPPGSEPGGATPQR